MTTTTNYTCEDQSICHQFQLAICLHCHHRLCLEHITEHHKIILNNLTNISKNIQNTFQQIKIESEKRQEIYDQILISLKQWNEKENDKLQLTYNQYLKSIQFQYEILENEEIKLFEQLEQNALQPLEYLQNQQNTNIEIIHQIEQTIEKVQENNSCLKWKIVTPVDIAYYPFNIPSVSLPIQSDNSEQITKKRKISSKKHKEKKLIGHSLKRLVMMFSNIRFIEKRKKDIRTYIKKQNGSFDFPNFICSYLTAWYRKRKLSRKFHVLNEYISIIQEFLSYRKDVCDILFGTQIFFYHEIIQEDKNQIMASLLQFFLDHQCLNKTTLFKWYNDIKSSRYVGLHQAKQLAKQFIQSLLSPSIVDHVQTISTSSSHMFNFQIKHEQNSNETD